MSFLSPLIRFKQIYQVILNTSVYFVSSFILNIYKISKFPTGNDLHVSNIPPTCFTVVKPQAPLNILMIKQDEMKFLCCECSYCTVHPVLIRHRGSLLSNNCNNYLSSRSLGSKPLLNHVTLDRLWPPNNLIRLGLWDQDLRSGFLWPPNQTRFISKWNTFCWVWLQLRALTVANQTVTIISRELIKNKSVRVAK